MAVERESGVAGEVRVLLRAAMAIFVVTVVIGILNGLDVVAFSRELILVHVHAGTLGWITLAVLAAALALLAQGGPMTAGEVAGARRLGRAAVVAIPLYLVAFATGSGVFRPIAGTLVLAVLAAFTVWAVRRGRRLALRVPQLAVLAALVTLTLGAVVGVLIGLQMAGRITFLPAGAFGAHPATLVVGYLILAGMAIIEWRLLPADTPRDRLGTAQVALPFLAGVALLVGVMLDVFPLIAANLPLELAGVGIFVWRIRRPLMRVSWTGGVERHFAIGVAFLLVNVALLVTTIVGYADDLAAAPGWLLFALDHSIFIGVMTNALFGLVLVAADGRAALPWAEQLGFWSTNVGLAGFVVSLLLGATLLERVFAPLMGTGILLTMLACAWRTSSQGGTMTARPVPSGARLGDRSSAR